MTDNPALDEKLDEVEEEAKQKRIAEKASWVAQLGNGDWDKNV